MILKNFAISSTDTLQNIFVKISALLNSLPKYIHLVGVKLDIQELRSSKVLTNVEVVDIFEIIKSENEDINRFVKNLKMVIDLFPNLDKVNDIIKPWMYYNLQGLDQEDFSLILFSIVNTINKGLNTKYDIDFVNFFESSRLFVRDINEKIEENKRLAQVLFSSDVNIEGKFYTPFSLEKIKYSLDIGQKFDITLNEVFNSIVLNSVIPFAAMGEYYKVLKDFVPDQQWLSSIEPNCIILKLIKSEKEYEDVRLKVENGVFKVILEADIEKASKDSVIQTVFNVIRKANPVITKEEPISVKGVFYIPDQSLEKYVFAHLVMNDPSFSVLVIDEVGKASKEKNSIYSYYNTGEYMMSTIITPKIMDRFDPTMKGQSQLLFPEGSKYLRIRVTMKNEKDAKEMQDIFSKIISLYNIRYDDVVTLYRKYIPMFPEESKSKKVIKTQKKKAGESRRCQHFPLIIGKDDISNYSDYMTFPLDKEGQIYTCETEKLGKFKYVGLQYRKENSSFSPCCFEVNQKTKTKSNYNKYVEFINTGNADIFTQKIKQQRVITTKKYVDNGNFGDVYYDNVSKFFEICDDSVKYFRLGVHRSKMSFINCIMEVVREPDTPTISVNDVRSKLNEMANNASLISLCRQSIPDKTPEEIKYMLLSEDTYIDPKLFLTMVEVEFNCKIFLFSENGMEVPQHLKNYLRYETAYNKVVTVIEHVGSESQNAQYPQCELIVYVKNTTSIYYYQPSDNVSVKAESIFCDMISSYILGEKLDKYSFDLDNAVGQHIDSYGKASAFVIKNPKGNFILYSSIPMPPYKLPENVEPTYTLTYNDVIDIYGNLEFITMDEMFSDCVCVTLQNKYYIPIVKTRIPPGFKSVYDDVLIPKKDSALQTYNMYKKLARYITEYMFYMFSKYINENSLPMDVKSIEKFVISSVVVQEDVNYGYISKKFTSGTIMRDGKLIVPSNEILKRLVYSLRLEIFRDPDMILSYHNRKNIEGYILEISDFSYVPSQVILYGADTVLRYIYELENSHVINYNIGFAGQRPFFYKNRDIEDGKVFLAQAVDTLEDAKSVTYNWEKHRTNISNGIHNIKINLYKYDSTLELLRKGKGNVLGYKIKGKVLFTVLMDINKIEKIEETKKEIMFLEDLLAAYSEANVDFPPQLYVHDMKKEDAIKWLKIEIMDLAANSARDHGRKEITKTDILRVLNVDDEINKIFELVGEKVDLDPGFKPRHIDIS